jgi:hypothetical protein
VSVKSCVAVVCQPLLVAGSNKTKVGYLLHSGRSNIRLSGALMSKFVIPIAATAGQAPTPTIT